jgi:hypothetical protein
LVCMALVCVHTRHQQRARLVQQRARWRHGQPRSPVCVCVCVCVCV